MEALRRLQILDSGAEAAWDRLVQLASLACDAPIALATFVDEDRQWFKARVGLAAQETPREHAFCAHAILDAKVFVVEDAENDPRFQDNPLVLGEPFIRFYAGAPIQAPTGERMGTICVIDEEPRALAEKDRAVLELIAGQAGDLLMARQVALMVHELLTRKDPRLRRNALAHRLRTPMTPLALSLALLKRESLSDEALAVIDRMERNLAQLEQAVTATTDDLMR